MCVCVYINTYEYVATKFILSYIEYVLGLNCECSYANIIITRFKGNTCP